MVKIDYTDGVVIMNYLDGSLGLYEFDPKKHNLLPSTFKDEKGTHDIKYDLDPNCYYESMNWNPLKRFRFRHPIKTGKELFRVKRIAVVAFEYGNPRPITNASMLNRMEYKKITPQKIRQECYYQGWKNYLKSIKKTAAMERPWWFYVIIGIGGVAISLLVLQLLGVITIFM